VFRTSLGIGRQLLHPKTCLRENWRNWKELEEEEE